MSDTISSKKLKQAQLCFGVGKTKTNNLTCHNDDENKENSSKPVISEENFTSFCDNINASLEDKPKNRTDEVSDDISLKSDSKENCVSTMDVVDLTDDHDDKSDNGNLQINEAIERVVQKARLGTLEDYANKYDKCGSNDTPAAAKPSTPACSRSKAIKMQSIPAIVVTSCKDDTLKPQHTIIDMFSKISRLPPKAGASDNHVSSAHNGSKPDGGLNKSSGSVAKIEQKTSPSDVEKVKKRQRPKSRTPSPNHTPSKITKLNKSSSSQSAETLNSSASGCEMDDSSCNEMNISSELGIENQPVENLSKKPRKRSLAGVKKALEKEKEKQLKKQQRAEEKLLREQEKVEMKRKKEQERLEKEEMRKQKKEEEEREREIKQKRRMEELELKKEILQMKMDMNKRKEEEKQQEKLKREMEKQKLDAEKQKIEDEKKRIAEKRASTFKSFFKSPSTKTSPPKPVKESENVGSFVAFQLKEDMFLAPVRRRNITTGEITRLDDCICRQNNSATYLEAITPTKLRKRNSRTNFLKRKRKQLSLDKDGVELCLDGDDTASICQHRAKLLQFYDNNRPPYYGTWRKKSESIVARNPFKKDAALLDYELDSDDEWEDPGEGEDIANSDGEEESGEKEDDDEEEGDGFFVPHGYLSDDEGINDGDSDCEGDDVPEEELSEQRLKVKQQEFEQKFKQKIRRLTPISIGCVWEDAAANFSRSVVDTLKQYEWGFFADVEFPISLEEDKERMSTPTPENGGGSASKVSKAQKVVPEEAMPDLIRLLHGNPYSANRLVREFQQYWQLKVNGTATSDVGPQVTNNTAPKDKSVEIPSPTCNVGELTTSIAMRSASPVAFTSKTELGGVRTPSPSLASGVTVLTSYAISRTQLMKKIKEMSVYGRVDGLSRSCWFVTDAVFEKYSLDRGDFPVPNIGGWGYVTEMPEKVKVERIVPVPPIPPAASSEVAPAPPSGVSIAAFASKIAPEELIEKSAMKHASTKQEKEVEVEVPTSVASSISKYTTTKMSPSKLLELSRQKSLQEQASRSRRVQLTTVSLAPPTTDKSVPAPEENGADSVTGVGFGASFSVPSHSAFKTFFKVQGDGGEKVYAAPSDDVINLEEAASSSVAGKSG